MDLQTVVAELGDRIREPHQDDARPGSGVSLDVVVVDGEVDEVGTKSAWKAVKN